jgi:hypothetical protein
MTAPGPSKTEQILTAIETLLASTYGIKKDNLAKPSPADMVLPILKSDRTKRTTWTDEP